MERSLWFSDCGRGDRGGRRVAASKGLVTIVPDLRFGSQATDFDLLVAHLSANGRQYGLDTAAIAVYAGSGNVFSALPIVEDPKRGAIKSAAMFYGNGPVTEFRRDLPLLLVRAGLDRPGVNSSTASGLTGLAALALSQNAPVTVINNAGGHHAFEIADDDAITRDVIDQTIEFVKRTTSSAYQAAMRATLLEATAAAHVMAETAIAWLQSIPKRFLPPSIKDEPTFAPLKGAEDFEELFRPD